MLKPKIIYLSKQDVLNVDLIEIIKQEMLAILNSLNCIADLQILKTRLEKMGDDCDILPKVFRLINEKIDFLKVDNLFQDLDLQILINDLISYLKIYNSKIEINFDFENIKLGLAEFLILRIVLDLLMSNTSQASKNTSFKISISIKDNSLLINTFLPKGNGKNNLANISSMLLAIGGKIIYSVKLGKSDIQIVFPLKIEKTTASKYQKIQHFFLNELNQYLQNHFRQIMFNALFPIRGYLLLKFADDSEIIAYCNLLLEKYKIEL